MKSRRHGVAHVGHGLRIAKQLGDPERCPHGWPVDTDFEQAENRELRRANEILRKASAHSAQAELDRRSKP